MKSWLNGHSDIHYPTAVEAFAAEIDIIANGREERMWKSNPWYWDYGYKI